MLLLIDAGNTRVKWAMVPNLPQEDAALGKWEASGQADHGGMAKLAQEWRAHEISRVLASNVAGGAMRDALEQTLFRAIGIQPVPLVWFASVPELAGVRNGYRNPAQLGCDRFASAIGARALYPGRALIVATCGTATTVDAIDENGLFMGGMILPGPVLMAQSLARNTAQLPQVAERFDGAAPFADNTDEAIASGCVLAQAGAIGRAVEALTQDHDEITCLLSGGAAPLIAPHLNMAHEIVENLVLIGLHQVALQYHRQHCAPC